MFFQYLCTQQTAENAAYHAKSDQSKEHPVGSDGIQGIGKGIAVACADGFKVRLMPVGCWRGL